MPKGRSQGSGAIFEIKYMDAALDADAFAAESSLDDGLTPFFIDREAHPWLPLFPTRDDRTAGDAALHLADARG